MSKVGIAFFGCGFLATHLIPHLLPHIDQEKYLILIDRERVEKVNYDNSIFPKNYVNKRKVTAIASDIQIHSSVHVIPIHEDVKTSTKLVTIYNKYHFDFLFCTVDNAKSRKIAREFAIDTNIPTMFIGVTEGLVYIDWAENIVLPESEEDMKRVNAEIKRIRDVCTRLEFRVLGVIASGYAYHIFLQWLENGQKLMYQISVRDNISATYLKRER